jgi:ubiquinone/menaquinone biosynthesis C-methylase UbiE
MFDQGLDIKTNLYHYPESEKLRDFEELYLKIRRKENRLYSDDIVKYLPAIYQGHPLFYEWQIRKVSLFRLISYFKETTRPIKIMELGCGNGWLANHLSRILVSEVYGVDINKTELEQAARIFNERLNLKFIYGNIFENIFEDETFDHIVMSGSIQYFPDLHGLINLLLKLLKDKGELHILDSPIYKNFEVINAKKNSEKYYSYLGYPEMSRFYHHHTIDELTRYKYEVIYDPGFNAKLLRRIFPKNDSPFPWIKIPRPKNFKIFSNE